MNHSDVIKRKNRKFLKKTYYLKLIFYPLIAFIGNSEIILFFEKPIDWIIRLFGVNKSVHTFIKHRDFAKWFKGEFTKNTGDKILLIPTQVGANSNFILLNLLFSKYFQQKGFKPILFVCNSSVEICMKETYFKNRSKNPNFCRECFHGYNKIRKSTGIEILMMNDFFDDYLKVYWIEQIAIIEKIESLTDCKNFEYSGFGIGVVAEKNVLRYLLQGKFYNVPYEIDIYKKILKASVKHFLIIKKLFETRLINNSILANGTLAFESIYREFCHRNNVNYITYETFTGSNSVIYKKNDEVMNLSWPNEWSVFKKNTILNKQIIDAVEKFFSSLQSGNGIYTKWNAEHETDKLKGVKRYACLFTNLNIDTAVLSKHNIFIDMEDWIISVIDFWERSVNGLTLVIRVHPAEVKHRTATAEFMGDRIKKHIKTNDIILLDSTDKVNSYVLLKGMEFSMVYSSTIGLETAFLGKPCLVAGMPYYRNHSFILSPSSNEEYFQTLGKLISGQFVFKIDRNELFKLVYFTFFERTKMLKGIKLSTPNGECNSIYSAPEIMINENRKFFEDFYNELINKDTFEMQ
ncbi:MAG: hypothetical protein IPM71_08810 [Bacteroidota bacterium]|nr:MAG: hypothetical protein IPM71_08810 [Bacteroidota bacterium]